MKKQIRLQSRLMRVSMVCLLISCGMIALCLTLDSMRASSEADLMRARTDLSFKQTEVNTLTNQIENTKGAQVQFSKYVLTRKNTDFSANVDAAKILLSTLREQMNLGQDLRLTLNTDVPLNDPVFSNLPHKISMREATKINMTAATDMHIFSFAQALQAAMPGIIEILALKVTMKNSGIDNTTLTQISTGGNPALADAELVFNWYNIQPKAESKP